MVKKNQTPQSPKGKLKKEPPKERPVIYNEVTSTVCLGETAITVSDAKELLGWEEETEDKKFGSEFLLRDLSGTKVRCTNNVTNRPIYPSVLGKLTQEHLTRKWVFNGEPIIVGETGLILNGQHTLISLILGQQEISRNPDRWGESWKDHPLTMDKMIVSGVDEDDRTVNTMDTCKPRSLADVIYRSEFFLKAKANDRRACSTIAAVTIKFLWHRTGTPAALGLKPTHSQYLDFVARHPRILQCVKHIYEEDSQEGKISKFLPLGYAAAMLYLMGSSTSDPEKYLKAEVPDESILSWDRWDRAADFWVLFAGCNKTICPVREALVELQELGSTDADEKLSIFCLGWNAFVAGEEITEETLKLEFITDPESGRRKLVEVATVGGIDMGDPEAIPTNDPTPEEIDERSKEVRQAKVAPGKDGRKEKVKLGHPVRSGAEWAVNDVAWVADEEDGPYLGKISEEPYQNEVTGEMMVQVLTESGDKWEVLLDTLFLMKPSTQPKKKMPRNPPPAKHRKDVTPEKLRVGQVIWVVDGSSEPYRARIKEVEGKNARVQIDQGFQGAGNVVPVRCTHIRLQAPVAA